MPLSNSLRVGLGHGDDGGEPNINTPNDSYSGQYWPKSPLRPNVLELSGVTIAAQSVNTGILTPLTSVVFICITSTNVTATVTSVSGLGGTWSLVKTQAQGTGVLTLYVGIGCQGPGRIHYEFDGGTSSRHNAIEFLGGINQTSPVVATNSLSQGGGGQLRAVVTPNAFARVENAYLVFVKAGSSVDLTPVAGVAIEVNDAQNTANAECNYAPGFTGGQMGASIAVAATMVIVGTEVAYDPTSVAAPTVWPQAPDNVPSFRRLPWAPFRLPGQIDVEAPQVAAGGDATATPATIDVTVSVPAPTVIADAIVTPSTIAAAASVLAPTVQGQGQPTPATVAATVSVLAPTVKAAAVATPSTIAATVSLPAPTILTGGDVTVSPATIAATVSVLSPTVLAAAKPTPAVVAATVSVPAPTIQGTAKPTPTTVAAAASILAPTVQAAAKTTPTTIAVAASLPAPTILVGGDALAQPATIAATTSVLAPTVRGTAVVTGVTIVGVVALPAPTVFGGEQAGPVKGPTYGRSLVGDDNATSELAGRPNRTSSLAGAASDTEELAGAPRAVPIGSGSNSIQET